MDHRPVVGDILFEFETAFISNLVLWQDQVSQELRLVDELGDDL